MFTRSTGALFLTCVVAVLVASYQTCFAQAIEQPSSSTTVSDTVGTFATQIALREGETVHDGDLVSYDVASGTYVLTQSAYDPYLFGVIVLNPVIYSHNDEEGRNLFPVVRFGEVLVNVSTLNGEIKAGDLVTSSRIQGLGQRFGDSRSGQVLGIALSDMVFEPTAIDIDGTTVRLGRVSVGLRIGFQTAASDTEDVSEGGSENNTDENKEKRGETVTIPEEKDDGVEALTFLRYILGATVMLGSFVVALRHFGGYYKEGVIAVGRNPLAHQQIRSLILWNTLMIILTTGAGFIIGMMIMFV